MGDFGAWMLSGWLTSFNVIEGGHALLSLDLARNYKRMPINAGIYIYVCFNKNPNNTHLLKKNNINV